MLKRDRDGGEPEHQLHIEQEQNGDIAKRRGVADARVEQPPMHQERRPDEAGDAGNAANHDRHHLLEAMRDAEEIEHGDGRQQAHEMAEEDDENADMEEVRAPHQLLAAQELT